MIEYKLGEIETRFADIIWENEPLSSGDLVKLALQKLTWKKSTTYTILRKLCEKSLFSNENGVVTSLISKDEYITLQSKKFVDETFSGSLPAFLAAFAGSKGLSEGEILEIQRIIDEHKEDKHA